MTLKDSILQILYKNGCLNTHEICRAVNGYNIHDPTRCGLSTKLKPFGKGHWANCNGQIDKKCKYDYYKVRCTLFRMKINTVSMRFWDKTRLGGNNRRSDVFRFWFINHEDFRRRVLAQTLIPWCE
jgi:hypothetical protein